MLYKSMEKKKLFNLVYFFGGWWLWCGCILLLEFDGGIELIEEFLWLIVVDGEGVINSDFVVFFVGGKFVLVCVGLGGVLFLLEGVVVLLIGFEVCGFFDGVDVGV